MKTLFYTIKQLKVDGAVADIDVSTDGEELYVRVYPRFSGSALSDVDTKYTLSGTLVYNGTSRAMSLGNGIADPSPEGVELSFPYSESAKTLKLLAENIRYNYTAVGNELELSWAGGMNDPDPKAGISYTGARSRSNFSASYSFTSTPAGMKCALVGVRSHTRYPEYGRAETDVYVDSYREGSSVSSSLNTDAELEVKFQYIFAIYPENETDHDRYVGLCHVYTEDMIITYSNAPFTPREITYGRPGDYEDVEISWRAVTDSTYPTQRYQVEASVDGGEFMSVYSGTSKSCYFGHGSEPKSHRFRVRAVGSKASSPWLTGKIVRTSTTGVHIACGGTIKEASAVYIGSGGNIKEVSGLTVG